MAWGDYRYRNGGAGFCAACGNALDRPGAVCNACLQKQVAQASVAAMVLGLIGVGAYYYYPLTRHPDKQVVVDPQDAATLAAEAERERKLRQSGVGGWIYFDTSDRLVGDTTHHARLVGRPPALPAPANQAPAATTNTQVPRPDVAPASAMATPAPVPAAAKGSAMAPAPAAAPPHVMPMLELSASAHYGRRAIFTFPKTSLVCAGKPCNLLIAFDEGPLQALTYQDISDDNATVLASNDFDTVYQPLTHAHDLLVMLTAASAPDPVAPPAPVAPPITPKQVAGFISNGFKSEIFK